MDRKFADGVPCLVREGMIIKPLVRKHESEDDESESGIRLQRFPVNATACIK
jgi:hypothetical protein